MQGRIGFSKIYDSPCGQLMTCQAEEDPSEVRSHTNFCDYISFPQLVLGLAALVTAPLF